MFSLSWRTRQGASFWMFVAVVGSYLTGPFLNALHAGVSPLTLLSWRLIIVMLLVAAFSISAINVFASRTWDKVATIILLAAAVAVDISAWRIGWTDESMVIKSTEFTLPLLAYSIAGYALWKAFKEA